MPEKYDLNRMMAEIKEDEHVDDAKKKQMTQEDITRMMLERLRARGGKKHD